MSDTFVSEYIPTEDEQSNPPPPNPPELPAILDAATFALLPMVEPPQVVHGVLHQGSKCSIVGGSKSFKTWTLLDLGLSVAYGKPWLSFPTTAGKVLFVNFEIQDFSFQSRIKAVAAAKTIQLNPNCIYLLNLRGKASNYSTLLHHIASVAKGIGFSLIILDPIYKLYGNADENSARDIAGLLNAIEALAVETGAAIAFGAHFSKGNQSGKESIDRVSGSGVFARDPDSLLVMTRHETEGAFVIETTLRNFPQVEPFVVRWQYPLMHRDAELDPARLKQAVGRKPAFSNPAELLAHIAHTSQENPISVTAWATAAKLERSTLRGYLAEMRAQGWIATVGEGNAARQFLTDKGRQKLQEGT
jgi:hypothetical protein